MPKRPLTPQEKKRLAYERDHYNRGGQSLPAWRRLKRRKKRKSTHSLRRKQRLQLLKLGGEDDSELAARRRYTTLKVRKVHDWGAIGLREFVDTRRARSQLRRGQELPRGNHSASLGDREDGVSDEGR